MRIARFEHEGRIRLGRIDGTDVIDVGGHRPQVPSDLGELLQQADGLERFAVAASAAPRLPLSSVRLLAPLSRPGKFLGIGRNYAGHAAERGGSLAQGFPVFFNKQTSCVCGPLDPILIPSVSEQVDYEGELGMVIGRRASRVAASDAPRFVAGFLVVNDVSVRDWQGRSPTMTLGKSFDTHGPIGPWLVTADEIPDPHRLRLRTWVNDELMQDASTEEMIWSCWQQIEVLSTACTLEPGDIVTTGTPAGVGAARTPPRWLRNGDIVRIEVESVGILENPVARDSRGEMEIVE